MSDMMQPLRMTSAQLPVWHDWPAAHLRHSERLEGAWESRLG